jgi:hypothetical protein
VRHPGGPEDLHEVPGAALPAFVGSVAWPGIREIRFRALQDNRDLGLGDGFANPPVDRIAAGAIENRSQTANDSVDVDVRMQMRLQRLLESNPT